MFSQKAITLNSNYGEVGVNGSVVSNTSSKRFGELFGKKAKDQIQIDREALNNLADKNRMDALKS